MSSEVEKAERVHMSLSVDDLIAPLAVTSDGVCRSWVPGAVTPRDDRHFPGQSPWSADEGGEDADFDAFPSHDALHGLRLGRGVPLASRCHTAAYWPAADDRLVGAVERGFIMPETMPPASYSEGEVGNALTDAGLLWWPQFVVPRPDAPARWPWMADFLVVFRYQTGVFRPPTFRFAILEVDGPHHAERVDRDRERDGQLHALGYEVYRVSAAWARVDPYAVVEAFLAAAKVPARMHFPRPPTLALYRCSLCGEPMVRWDTGWIHTLSSEDHDWHLHRDCAESDGSDFAARVLWDEEPCRWRTYDITAARSKPDSISAELEHGSWQRLHRWTDR